MSARFGYYKYQLKVNDLITLSVDPFVNKRIYFILHENSKINRFIEKRLHKC